MFRKEAAYSAAMALAVVGGAVIASSALLKDRGASFAVAQERPIVLPCGGVDVALTTLAAQLEHPWGLAFLPGGDLLVTERVGRLRLVRDGKLLKAPVAGLPAIEEVGQGGLLDVAVDPAYADNGFIYFSYAEPGADGYGTAVARARLSPGEGAAPASVSGVRVIYRQTGKTSGGRHFGSRLVFARDGTLFITNGERGERHRAQDPFDHAGSVLRINPDGSIPPDNPYADGKKALPQIWSIGHRNAQGAALHPVSGELWTLSHGPRGGDEINIARAARNYGWPVISYGRNYIGTRVGEGTHKPGMEQPVYYWDPSIAPSGLAFYTGSLFPAWRGNLFAGALKYQLVARLVLEGNRVVREERCFGELQERIRDVRSGPDGALWLLTDSPEGRILRLAPAG